MSARTTQRPTLTTVLAGSIKDAHAAILAEVAS